MKVGRFGREYPPTLEFKNIRNQQPVPFVFVADCEALTKKLPREANRRKTLRTEQHLPCSVGFQLLAADLHASQPELINLVNTEYESHTGADCIQWFLTRLQARARECLAVLFDDRRLVMTPDDQAAFDAAEECSICHRRFDEPEPVTDAGNADEEEDEEQVHPVRHRRNDFEDDEAEDDETDEDEEVHTDRRRGPDMNGKVRDHDHLTGKFRGAAHNRCNLRMKKSYKIPVFFHNFRGYDSHLIVKGMAAFPEMKIRIIGQTLEKYLTVSWGDNIVFKDSFQFMSTSLDTLVKNLAAAGKDKFAEMKYEFRNETEAKLDLLLRKGVYPYEYMDSWEKLDKPELPTRADFFNGLKQEECSEQEYAHAQTVWREFGCQRMKDYTELYLKTDVLLLGDVLQAFRKVCIKHYELDPAHYVSSPQLAWDAMLKLTKVKLELISDPAMYEMIASGIRGGICMISKRFARANHENLGPTLYDPSKPPSTIAYLDANNLYGWAMSQKLPFGGFKWMDERNLSAVEHDPIGFIDQDRDSRGYVFEVDLEYPASLHVNHNDYPLAPERLNIEQNWLSDEQLEIRTHYNMRGHETNWKLVPHFLNRTKYVLHSEALKFYLEHGMIVKKIHRGIQFSHSNWMESYVALNATLRAAAANDFERDFFKIMVNAVYGKTVENQSKRTDIRIVQSRRACKKLTEKPHCMSFRIFHENFAAVQLRKIKIHINKPFYVGFTVLDFSKIHMYNFHYDYIKPQYGDRAQLLFTDTDSLMYQIAATYQDVYADFKEDSHFFDLSGLPTTHPSYDATNKKVVGKFKDESNGDPLLEFIGLRPKMYSFITVSDAETGRTKDKHRAKGIASAAARSLRHADYARQFKQPFENYQTNRRIGSDMHVLYTLECRKRGLCAFDDKRFLLGTPDADGATLAYGHWRTPAWVAMNQRDMNPNWIPVAQQHNPHYPPHSRLELPEDIAQRLIEEVGRWDMSV